MLYNTSNDSSGNSDSSDSCGSSDNRDSSNSSPSSESSESSDRSDSRESSESSDSSENRHHNCFGPSFLFGEGVLSTGPTPSSFYLLVDMRVTNTSFSSIPGDLPSK